ALVNNKCKEPEELVLVQPVSCSNETVSKVAAQNADAVKKTTVLISSMDPFRCSQTKTSWSYIDVNLA
ncbi:unnamed protein product, partial [Hymenolepis diminuta]